MNKTMKTLTGLAVTGMLSLSLVLPLAASAHWSGSNNWNNNWNNGWWGGWNNWNRCWW